MDDTIAKTIIINIHKQVRNREILLISLSKTLRQKQIYLSNNYFLCLAGLIKRIIWLLFFLAATGYLIFSIYSLTVEYLKYDVSVKVLISLIGYMIIQYAVADASFYFGWDIKPNFVAKVLKNCMKPQTI